MAGRRCRTVAWRQWKDFSKGPGCMWGLMPLATGLRTRLKEKLCPGKMEQTREGEYSAYYSSLLALLVYAVLCGIFQAFSTKIEEIGHSKRHWKSCKAYFKEKLYMASLCLKLFVGLGASIGPSFVFLWFSELKQDVRWSCSPFCFGSSFSLSEGPVYWERYMYACVYI